MAAFHEITAHELVWVKPRRTKLQFELCADEHVLATLAWREKGRALGQWAGERYWFSREGWFRPRTIVRKASAAAFDALDANAQPVATFVHRGSGGSLVFSDGRLFTWKKPKMWTTERIWAEATTVLVRFRLANWRSPATVTIQPEAAAHAGIPLLILLGQYLHVRASQDAEAASAAATVATFAASS